MRMSVVCMLALIVIPRSISADSLWDPDSTGLLIGSGDLKVGDTVLVSIESESTLSYTSSRVDAEEVSLELSGGDGAGLFSFLPVGSAVGNVSLQGAESLSVRATFAVRVVGIDEAGQLNLQGSRTISIQGKQESIILSGVVDPMFVGEDRLVPFSSIADARLTYTTLLESGAGVLRAEDLSRPILAPTDVEVATTPELALSDEKRDELILVYLNRLLDLIFE